MNSTATATTTTSVSRSEVPESSGIALAARQTFALLLDSYRELSARRLFWISMMLSGIVVLAFGIIGINENGLTAFGFEIGLPLFSTKLMAVGTFYKLLFFSLGITIWLTWAATILALISTASIVPDMVASGAIETTLSKPISRVRFFLTKYCCATLFVALQVGVFSVCSLLVIGFRGGVWEPRLLLAVPIVVLVFTYLYCICALLGIITKSAVAALLLTILVWLGIFMISTAETALLSQRLSYDIAVQQHDEQITRNEKRLAEVLQREAAEAAEPAAATTAPAKLTAAEEAAKRIASRAAAGLSAVLSGKRTPSDKQPASDTNPASGASAETPPKESAKVQTALENLRTQRPLVADTRDSIAMWHRGLLITKTIIPKTAETTALLERYLFSENELADWRDNAAEGGPGRDGRNRGMIGAVRVSEARLMRAMESEQRSRSLPWILGTSLLFQAVVLGIAVVIFSRRDF